MNSRGSILIMTLSLMILLTTLVGSYLYAVGVFLGNSGWEETDAKLIALAEAGLHKAIWNLKTPTGGSGGQGESWTTAGTTESLGDGTYTMVVERWDFALAANGSTANDNPHQTSSSKGPDKAIDGNDSTYWESKEEPDDDEPQDLIIIFPYNLTINKVRFLVSGGSDRTPEDYTLAVSSNGASYTTVVTVTGNSSTNRTDTFSASSIVNTVKYLRLRVTAADKKVRIATFEAIGSRVTSTGTITVAGQTYTRAVQQTLVADDASPENQKAYVQSSWAEQ